MSLSPFVKQSLGTLDSKIFYWDPEAIKMILGSKSIHHIPGQNITIYDIKGNDQKWIEYNNKALLLWNSYTADNIGYHALTDTQNWVLYFQQAWKYFWYLFEWTKKENILNETWGIDFSSIEEIIQKWEFLYNTSLIQDNVHILCAEILSINNTK